jgi:hypothetical protein
MTQESIDKLGQFIKEHEKEIMDKTYEKEEKEHHLYAETFEVPVKKPLPPKKDKRFTYPSLD